MEDSPLNRAPVEIWERILLEVITSVSAPVFDATCTSSNYLAFKRTCGDGDAIAYRHEYKASERNRFALRLVCRAWKEIADRWDMRERWIRVSSLNKEVSDKRWRGALRVEFISPDGTGIWDGSRSKGHGGIKLRPVLFNWKLLGLEGGHGMQLKRLEMLHMISMGFDEIFKALCDASTALASLRSLAISIPIRRGRPLRAISRSFPELSHLTLLATYETFLIEAPDSDSPEDALQLRKLEVLFLFPTKGCYELSTWELPALQHFYGRTMRACWEESILPFLIRHSATIETLDLDDEPLSTTRFIPSIDNFWDTFSHLKLLRCFLGSGGFTELPDRDHALVCLVDTQAVNSAEELIARLTPWIDDDRVKRLGSIVMFGPYLSQGSHNRDRGPIRGVLQRLQWNGTRLMNPAGRAWIGTL